MDKSQNDTVSQINMSENRGLITHDKELITGYTENETRFNE